MNGGLVIVGAGHTGLRAALAARRARFAGEITLIDPDPTFPPVERPLVLEWQKSWIGSEILAFRDASHVRYITPGRFPAGNEKLLAEIDKM